MKLYKIKIKETLLKEVTRIEDIYGEGYAVTVQAVSYSSKSPEQKLVLFDADGDQFMFPVPGQAVTKPTTPEVPTSVKLPLSYVDTEGENEVIIWGEVTKIDPYLESSF